MLLLQWEVSCRKSDNPLNVTLPLTFMRYMGPLVVSEILEGVKIGIGLMRSLLSTFNPSFCLMTDRSGNQQVNRVYAVANGLDRNCGARQGCSREPRPHLNVAVA